jgi:type II secretory pathway pseudopilin PulG
MICRIHVVGPSRLVAKRDAEAGYTLVALIALMTVLALFAMAAAPSITQQAKREREQEAIFRGEQVAEAIRVFYNVQVRNGTPAGFTALPTNIDQLVEGVQIRGRTRKLQILRASAARDPLSQKGEWQLVKPRSEEITNFVRDLMVYTNNVPPPTNDNQLKSQQANFAPFVIAIKGLKGSPVSSGSSGSSGNSSGPYIGVSSSSTLNSVINYYGIDQHNRWVFTPLFR